MKAKRISFFIFCLIPVFSLWGVGRTNDNTLNLSGKVLPAVFGFRFDDNIEGPFDLGTRLSDEIYSLNVGAQLKVGYKSLNGKVEYHLGGDQYQNFLYLDNLKNDVVLLLSENSGDFTLYALKEYFFRASSYDYFNYVDDDFTGGVEWNPQGYWNFELKYKDFTRKYYSDADYIRNMNFVDQAFFVSITREINEKLSFKTGGGYNNRQYNRLALDSSLNPLTDIQTDGTWTVLLNARIYFDEILHEITLEHDQTHSNCSGFSYAVDSISWAAVVRPVSTLYLELFFRLYSKSYDEKPLSDLPDYKIVVDEDSQDLLSVKTSWEWNPGWSTSISLNRERSETIFADQYYIKNVAAIQIKRSF